MKSPRLLLSLAALCSAATFGFAAESQSAQAKKDDCAKDMACCTNADAKCCPSKDACCSADKADCKESGTCCTKDTACCDANGKCLDQHAQKTAATTTAAAPDASATMVVKAYLPIADALASDDFEKARHAAATLARVTKASGNTAVYQPTIGVVHAPDIAAAREAFKQLSTVVARLASNSSEFVVMNCPMAKADWVQTDAKVRNPYYGSAMLTCGAPKK